MVQEVQKVTDAWDKMEFEFLNTVQYVGPQNNLCVMSWWDRYCKYRIS